MAAQPSLHCYTGDETGLVKRVRLTASGGPVGRWGSQEAGAGVGCSCWGPPATGEELIGAGLDNGAVRFWRASDEAPDSRPVLAIEPQSPAAAISGVHATASRVIACDRAGCVRVWKWPDDAAVAMPAVDPALVESFETGGSASVASFFADGSRLALGDRDRDLVVWDVEAGTPSWRARNLANDNLDLQVPVWVSALCQMPTQPDVLAMATGYVQSRLRGEVRLYDASAQRRPVMRRVAPLGDEALRAVAATPDGRYVLAGSTSGSMCRLDVRMGLKPLGSYRGASGSIRAIAAHASLPLVVCASLDRHVRVYRLESQSGAPIAKAYLKQRLSSLLLSAETPGGGALSADADDVEAMLGALPAADDEANETAAPDESAGEAGEDDMDDDDDDGMDELDGGGGGGVGGAGGGGAPFSMVDDDDEEEEEGAAVETGAADSDGADEEAEEEEGGGAAPRSGAAAAAAGGAVEKRAKRNKMPSAKKLRRLAVKTADQKLKRGAPSAEGGSAAPPKKLKKAKLRAPARG